jgi:hypothetical protein
MILEVLNKQDKAVFRQGLLNTLPHYYEDILSMTLKHVMHNALLTPGEKAAGGNESGETNPPAPALVAASGAVPQATVVDAAAGPAEEAVAVAYSDPPPAVAAAAGVVQPSPTKAAPRRGGKGARNT